MNIFSASVGIAKKLEVPDDYFVLSQAISYQHYDLNNFNSGLFTFGNGSSRNLAYTIGISRNSKGNNPIFPTYGSDFSLTGKFTLPYSSFSGINYGDLENQEEYKLKNTDSSLSNLYDPNGNIIQIGDYINFNSSNQPYKVTDFNLAAADRAKVDQKKFNWLEYYKIKFKAEWFTTIYGKLVLRTLGEFGYLGAYNQGRGVVPFERFVVGGDGLGGNFMTSNENIQVRGYKNNGSLSVHGNNGDPIYNKFSL